MFLWVEVPGVDDTVELFKECLEHDVAFVPGDPFFAGESSTWCFPFELFKYERRPD